ncbi:MAG: hypothetical protein EOO42_23995 [Flavobacteriales bacterium]|nr:MAG: hypothetical protein EOO42_23995 [Flavobacteriales bacterium]
MKKVSEENKSLLKVEYDDFFKNEILFAVDRRDSFALLWIAYLLKDTDNEEIKTSIRAALNMFSKSVLVKNMLSYYNDEQDQKLLWDENKSRLDVRFKQYMTANELHDYLGISFAES